MSHKDRATTFHRAFSPAHISCIFTPYRGETELTTGSCGIGFTLDKGVYVTAAHGSNRIIVNGEQREFPTVRSVLEELDVQDIDLYIDSELPFSAGFGMSGGSAIGAALAINSLLDLNYPKQNLINIAHIAEVRNKTGLGDVGGQSLGGVVLRNTQGQPFNRKVLDLGSRSIYYKVFGPIETRSIIGDPEKVKKISLAAKAALNSIVELKVLTLESLISASRSFAFAAGLIQNPNVSALLNNIRDLGGEGSMIMLGDSVMSTVPFPESSEAKLSNNGASLL